MSLPELWVNFAIFSPGYGPCPVNFGLFMGLLYGRLAPSLFLGISASAPRKIITSTGV